MNRTGVAVAFCAGCLIASVLSGLRNPAAAQRPGLERPGLERPGAEGRAAGELLALSSTLEGGNQQLVLIDPRERILSVYQVDRQSGEIALKSVRHARWDMQIEHFNCAAPLPGEVRALLAPR